uniref:Proteasome endopeptidase complex n=1 Tax=Setaria italica TaxID=4555 RepID=K3XZ66_SETIT
MLVNTHVAVFMLPCLYFLSSKKFLLCSLSARDGHSFLHVIHFTCKLLAVFIFSQAADTQVISDYVRYFLHQHTIQAGQPATVKVAANLIRLLAYQNKNMLQAGMIIGGWDKYEGGQIFSVPLGGTILRQPFAIGGSGSSYLYALMDHEWREGMSEEEAQKFVVKVVSLAMARDGASGGVVRTVTINADGVKRNFYPGDKLPLWHDELEPHNSLLDILAAGNPDPMVQ